MTHPDIITTSVWDEPGNVDLLKTMWAEGKSASTIAAELRQGVTRNAVISKVHRLKLPGRDNAIRARPSRTTSNGQTSRRGNVGNPGQAKANVIVHRVEGRLRAEREREPFREGRLPVEDGVDVGHLLFADRKIGRECAYIPGDPADGAMCCGKPVKPGFEWCPEHWARVYNKGAAA